MQPLTDMNSEMPKAVVLMSGGMDSCVTAAIASRTYQVAALHASYAQRTERRELLCFHKLADHFRVFARLAVRLDYFEAIGGSSLTDLGLPVHDADLSNTDIPKLHSDGACFSHLSYELLAILCRSHRRAAACGRPNRRHQRSNGEPAFADVLS